jgi:carbon monoxide dehydrogenase subunit G
VQLEHSFRVPVEVEQAWQVLLDIERIGPCLPGAVIDSVDGDNFTGTVKVKVGPINLTYKGKASFVEKDPTAHRAVIDARGKDARGSGTASAKVTATLRQDGDATAVDVLTDLDITGKPAQFGRGVMADVGNKLLGQFADCLAARLGDGGEEAPPATQPAAVAEPAEPTDGPAAAAAGDAGGPDGRAHTPGGSPAPASVSRPAPRHAAVGRDADPAPINLIASAGPAVAKRLVPVGALALLAILIVLLRRRSR